MNKESAQKELDAIKDKVKELERIINEPSESKITKEKEMSDFLFSMINGSTMKFTGEEEITYYKGNEWVIQQDYKNGYLWIRYKFIWGVFESKYKLNYNQIKDFIAAWVEANTQWKGLTPHIR